MVVTFYSFKGGVGRSMALANVGEILANQGYRVLLCDWDVEAPGLEQYFRDDPRGSDFVARCGDSLGVMDLLREYKEVVRNPVPGLTDSSAAGPDSSYARVGRLLLRRPFSCRNVVPGSYPGVGELSLITAGRRQGEYVHSYAEAVRSFDWGEFYEKWAGDAYIDFFRKDLVGDPRKHIAGQADILLIDSRTGVTEQGGICTHHLADIVLLLTGANDANLEWTSWMASNLTNPDLLRQRGGRTLQVLPAAARVEQSAEKAALAEFQRRFLEKYRDYILQAAVGDPEEFARATEIPYVPYYSFKERVAAREAPEKRHAGLYGSYAALAAGLVQCGVRSGLLREPSGAGRATAPEPSRLKKSTWDSVQAPALLIHAVDSLDKTEAGAICRNFVKLVESADEPCPLELALRVLGILRRNRYSDLMFQVAGSLIETGQSAPQVRRLYAEAQIDEGNIQAALDSLKLLTAETKQWPDEYVEARLLTGRGYKSLYLSASASGARRAARNLELAVAAYYEAYQANQDRYAYAGVNVAALLDRAQRDGLTIEGFPNPREIAGKVMQAMDARWKLAASPAGEFFGDLTTAAEACLALRDFERACRFMAQGLALRTADIFEITSVLRQFTEVWQLSSDKNPGSVILPMLRSALLKRSGGSITVDPSEAVPAGPSGPNFKGEPVASLWWYRTGLDRCRGVARIESVSGSTFGTGFVLRGSQLHERLGHEFLLLTNAHIIGDEPTNFALRPEDARVRFEALHGYGPDHKVGEMVWFSPVHELDAALLRLDPPVDESFVGYPIADRLPDPGDRVLLIGYDGGHSLSFSLRDNLLLARNETFLHYRAPTEAGSSGSPIFDDAWNLIGIHHAGGRAMRALDGEGTYEANEGISIAAIIAALARLQPLAAPL